MQNSTDLFGEIDTYVFIICGACVGGLLGFLIRPSVPLIGQLPLEAVLTRGASYSGLDQILVPFAKQSFNYLLVGFILGGFGGFGARVFMNNESTRLSSSLPESTHSVEHYSSAMDSLRKGDHQNAYLHLKKATKKKPEHAEAHFHLAKLQEQFELYQRAKESYLKAASLSPENELYQSELERFETKLSVHQDKSGVS